MQYFGVWEAWLGRLSGLYWSGASVFTRWFFSRYYSLSTAQFLELCVDRADSWLLACSNFWLSSILTNELARPISFAGVQARLDRPLLHHWWQWIKVMKFSEIRRLEADILCRARRDRTSSVYVFLELVHLASQFDLSLLLWLVQKT
jgi:hypothetical protein